MQRYYLCVYVITKSSTGFALYCDSTRPGSIQKGKYRARMEALYNGVHLSYEMNRHTQGSEAYNHALLMVTIP